MKRAIISLATIAFRNEGQNHFFLFFLIEKTDFFLAKGGHDPMPPKYATDYLLYVNIEQYCVHEHIMLLIWIVEIAICMHICQRINYYYI